MTPTTPPPTLDFAVIRSRCPKAFGVLQIWLMRNYDRAIKQRYTDSEPYEWAWWRELTNPRDLFDFFDKQGVIVTVYYEMLAYHVSIHIAQDTIWLNSATSATRAAAEAAAFTAGFAKLEEMLGKEEK